MDGGSGRRRLRRLILVAGVLVGGLVSGSVLGAGALVVTQWALTSDPLFAEPAEAFGPPTLRTPG
jgi:hypothetical protein